MKQLIVMIAMVILGVAIAGFVMDFKNNAGTISDATNDKINMTIFGE